MARRKRKRVEERGRGKPRPRAVLSVNTQVPKLQLNYSHLLHLQLMPTLALKVRPSRTTLQHLLPPKLTWKRALISTLAQMSGMIRGVQFMVSLTPSIIEKAGPQWLGREWRDLSPCIPCVLEHLLMWKLRYHLLISLLAMIVMIATVPQTLTILSSLTMQPSTFLQWMASLVYKSTPDAREVGPPLLLALEPSWSLNFTAVTSFCNYFCQAVTYCSRPSAASCKVITIIIIIIIIIIKLLISKAIRLYQVSTKILHKLDPFFAQRPLPTLSTREKRGLAKVGVGMQFIWWSHASARLAQKPENSSRWPSLILCLKVSSKNTKSIVGLV